MAWAVLEIIGVQGSIVFSSTILDAAYVGGNSGLTWTGNLPLNEDSELRIRIYGFGVSEFQLTTITE